MPVSNKSNIKLSIIVPHYNVIEFADCLYQVLFSQITGETELLLVEDCSNDGTRENLKILESTNTNENIKFLYLEENLGLSGARNYGASYARGEYLWFLDSDDTVHEKAVHYISGILKSCNPDGVVFDFFWFHADLGECHIDKQSTYYKARSQFRSFPAKKLISDKNQLIQILFRDKQLFAWAFVYKKELWLAHPFPEGKKFEDVMTIPKVVFEGKDLYYFPKPLVYYRQRNNSILSKPNLQSCKDMIVSMKEISHYFKKQSLSKEAQLEVYTFYLRMIRWSLKDIYENGMFDSSQKQYIEKELKLFKDQLPWDIKTFLSLLKEPKFKFSSYLLFYHLNVYLFTRNIEKHIRNLLSLQFLKE